MANLKLICEIPEECIDLKRFSVKLEAGGFGRIPVLLQVSPCDTVFVGRVRMQLWTGDVLRHTRDALMTRNVTSQITQIWFPIRRDHPSVKVNTYFPNSPNSDTSLQSEFQISFHGKEEDLLKGFNLLTFS